MIDPDGIQIQDIDLSDKISINMDEIEECDIQVYSLDNDKEYERYIKDIETQVRMSDEYKSMIAYLRDNMNMNECAFLKGVSNKNDRSIKIEIHHYPFSLRDITEIVVRKRQYYREALDVQMVAKEIMELHYKLMVGLISLSQTVHELAHSSRIFVPTDKVLGRYDLFVQYYKPFCDPEQLEVLDRIEKYTEEKQSPVLNTNILNQNTVEYDIKDKTYVLPDSSNINKAMLSQLHNIKENNYILPNVEELNNIKNKNKSIAQSPIRFDYSLIKKK
jgi:hypothetical protein